MTNEQIAARLREIASNLPNVADSEPICSALHEIANELEAQPAGDAGIPVVAHATNEGDETRVVSGRTMETARRSGGASATTMEAYTVPLIRQRDALTAIAARDARIAELERTLAETGGGARASTDTQRIEWMFLNCQDKSAEDLEFENPDAWRAWVDAAMKGTPS